MDLVTLVALALLITGVVGSVLPVLPGGLLSLAGVWTYYLFAPDGGLGALLLVSFTLVGLLAIAVEHVGGPLAARAGGASTRTTVAAGLAGALLFFVAGPVGIVVGVVGVVFLLELREGATPEEAARRSVYTAGGMLAAVGVELLLTLSMLVGFAVFVFWL